MTNGQKSKNGASASWPSRSLQGLELDGSTACGTNAALWRPLVCWHGEEIGPVRPSPTPSVDDVVTPRGEDGRDPKPSGRRPVAVPFVVRRPRPGVETQVPGPWPSSGLEAIWAVSRTTNSRWDIRVCLK